MIYKKTWFSIVLWALFSSVTGAMLAVYTILFWKNEIDTEVGYYTIVFGVLVLAMLIGCYILLNRVIFRQGRPEINKRAALLWEIVMVLCIYSAGLFYRIYLYLQSNAAFIETTECYDIASSDLSIKSEQILHGASSLYTFCLSVVMSFFGNNVDTAVWMQIFLQMLTLLLAYFAVKTIAGKIAACVTMLMLAVSSVYINKIFEITPECMFFTLYLIGMLIIGSFVKAYCTNRLSTAAAVCGGFCSGIVIGALIYLDAVSLTLFIFLPGIVTGCCMADSKNKKSEKIEGEFDNTGEKSDKTEDGFAKTEKESGIGFSILIFGIIIISAGLTAAGIFAIDSFLSGATYKYVILAWYYLYMEHLPIDYAFYQTKYSMIECYVQVILASFLIISFWNSKKTQNAAPWICLMLIMAITPLAEIGVLPYKIFSIFIWSVLAGIGLQQTCTTFKSESAEAAIAEAETDSTGTIAIKTAEKTMNAEAITANTEPAGTVESAKEDKPRFIENPLPLPKKHERKEMDFQYEVPEAKMKFDIDIKENDDFDI